MKDKRKYKIIANLEKQVELLQTDLDNKEHELTVQLEYSEALRKHNLLQDADMNMRILNGIAALTSSYKKQV